MQAKRHLTRLFVVMMIVSMLVTGTGIGAFAESGQAATDTSSTEAVTGGEETGAKQDADAEAAGSKDADSKDADVNDADEEGDEEVVETDEETEDLADEAADVETAADWEATLPEELSTDVRKAVVQVAGSQAGYKESADNFIETEDGDIKSYSRYSAFMEEEYADPWDADFVMFTLHYAGAFDIDYPSIPLDTDSGRWFKALRASKLTREIGTDEDGTEQKPEAGDIIFTGSAADLTDTKAAVMVKDAGDELVVIGVKTEDGRDMVAKFTVKAADVVGFVSLEDIAADMGAEGDEKAAGFGAVAEDIEKAAGEAAEKAEEGLAEEDENADADKEDADKSEEEVKGEGDAAAQDEKPETADGLALTDQSLGAKLVSAPGIGGKIRSLFTSNKGTEITVSGMLPESATVKAYPVKVEIPGQNVLAAYDITIYVPEYDENGEPTGKEVEWQPETPLSVSIKDKAIPESANELSVYHMENKKAEPEQIGTVASVAKSVEFEAESFSIYVIAEDTDTCTYRFVANTNKDGDTWTGEYTQLRQTLSNGDTLVEPTAPTKEGSLFDGWYEYDPDTQSQATTPFAGWGTVSGISTHSDGQPVNKEEKILVAHFTSENVKVTYYDQNESIVQTQEVAKGSTINPNNKNGANYVDYTPIQNEDGNYIVFQHWTDRPYGDKRKVESLPADTDISLYPVLGRAHYIHFNNNNSTIGGINTSYTGSIVVLPDKKPVEVSDDAETVEAGQYKPGSIVPTAPGYVFDGWYIKSDTSSTDKVFDANGHLVDAGWNKLMTKSGDAGLTYDPTLYAHWAPTNASYSVVYYTLKADAGTGRDPAKDYEFYKDMGTRQAATGSTVTRGSQDTVDNAFTDADDRAGFKLSTANNPTVTVKGDGTSTLAVYFDREQFNLKFYSYYGSLIKTITGLYGENISANFPIDPNNKATAWSDNDQSTFKYQFAAMNLMPPRNDAFQATTQNAGNGDYLNVYYLQVTNNEADLAKATTDKENYKKTYSVEKWDYYGNGNARNITLYEYVVGHDNNVYHLEREMRHSFRYITMGEEYYDIFGFEKNLTDTIPQFGIDRYGNSGDSDRAWSTQVNAGNNQGLYKLFYSRKEQTIHLKDTLNNRSEDVKFLYDEPITEDDSRVAKFAALANNEQIDADHYWFYDRACTNPVNFSDLKMPNHEMTFYAGLRKVNLVKLYPDGGEMLHGSGKSGNTYSTWYRLYDGETITPYEDLRRDYIAVDSVEGNTDSFWFDEHYYQPGDENKPKDQVQRYTAYQAMDPEHENFQKYIYSPGAYSFVGWFKVPDGQDPATYVIPETAAPYDTSTHVNANLTLKAKWQLMSQFSIVYDAGEGVHAPVDSNTYQEGANAIVKPSRSNPVGKQFRGWKVKGTTDPIYQPNGEILISEDLAMVNDDGSMTITLEAVYDDGPYKDNYTADYIFKVDDTVYYRQSLSPGEELVTPAEPEAPEGKSFTGWYEDAACKHKFSGFGTISNPVETILYAGFAKQHTVTYYDAKKVGDNWVKGDNIIQVQRYNDGDELDTSRVIYEFDSNRYVSEWNVQNGTSYTVNYRSSQTGYYVRSDLTAWPSMQDYSVLIFDSRGGTAVEPAKIPTDGSWPSRPVEPTRDGYQFLGWFTSPNQKYNTDGQVDPSAGEEYDFDEALPNGVTTLYAWWKPVGGKNTAEYTVVWWAQAASGDKTYEFQKSQKFTGKIGSTVDLTDGAWETEHGFDPTSVNNLVNYYSTTASENKSKYFEFAGPDTDAAALNIDPSEVTATIQDDGSTVLNLRFNRKRAWIGFDTDSKGTVYYKDGTYSGNNLYFIEAWLGREVADLWPAYDANRAADTTHSKALVMVDSDYYRNWTPQNPKSGLQPAATLQTVIDNKMMDSAEGKNYGDKENVLIYKLTTRTDATVVILHYIKDGREDINLTQELHRSTFRGVDYPDGSNYKYTENYSPKNLTGYTLITNNNIDKRNPSDDAVYAGYTPDIGAHGDYTGKTGQFIDDEVTTTIEKYEYTRKYPDRHYYTLAGYDRWGRPIYDELRVVIGNSGERYDVGLKYGDTDYVGTVYYRDWGGSYHSMSMDEFKSRDFVENVTYPTVTIESNINVFFYYAKEIYKVNLMELDGTTTKETLNVPYGDLVSDKLVGHDPTQAPAEGKTFVGWSVSPDTYEPFTSFMPARPITLYQIWDDTKVKVTTQGYDLNGDPISEGGEEGVYEAKYNSLFREFGVRDPKIAEPGYAFGGWEKEVEENGETKWKPIKLSERLVDDTLIKPVWIDIHAANVTYVLNGGDGTIEGTTPVDGEAGHYIDSSSYLLGSKAEIKSGAALTKTEGTGADAVNYRFVCWNTKEDGSGEDYYAGDSIALSSHGITLYARYVAKREVTLKYDLNADDDENAKFYDYNATKKKYEETTDTAKEYLLIDSGDSKTAAGKINNLYTAGTEINDAKVANNESLVKFLPVRPGYVFKGWSRKSEGPVDVKDGATIRVNTLENKSTTKTDTLYAIWEKDRLPIEVYTYEDEAIDDAVLKNKDSDGKTLAGYWRTTAMTAALPPDTVESAYHVQVGGDNAYKLDDFAYEKAIVIEKAGDNEAEKEIDKLQYVLKSDGSGYEWQYRLKAGNGSSGDASAFKPVSEEYPVKVYFHKNNTADLTITKTVEGKYANMGQEFTFTIRVEGAQSATYDYHDYTKSSTSGATPSDGTGATPSDGTGTTPSDGTSATTSGTTGTIADGGAFTLGHGGSITIKVPKNKKITITETPLVDGYTPSFTGGQHVTIQKDADDQVENGVVVKVNGQGGTLAVTNTFNDKSVVPSGIEGSNSILIPVFAGLVLALGLVMSISRRRRLGIRK